MSDRITCHLCAREMDAHASYVVRIEVFADPSMPEMSKLALDAVDFDEELDDLMDAMKGMSADELQDAVHRQFEFRLCPSCQRQFLANPLGKPRILRAGNN
jgi:hypothetical protein